MSGDRTGIQRPSAHPPDADFFRTTDPAPRGDRAAVLELGSLSIGFEGMDAAWHRMFLGHYSTYARDTSDLQQTPTLGFAASSGDRDHFIAPPQAGVATLNPMGVVAEPDPHFPDETFIRACTYSLAASFSTRGGKGRLIFARKPIEPLERSVENILRVAIAWLAVSQGGLLMHSASIIKDGEAYLFFGQSGAGKSTLAAMNRRGKVVSDDLTLLLPGEHGHPHVVGSPFRGTYTQGEPVTGRFPVRAAFRLKKASPAESSQVRSIGSAVARAEAIANLPFLVDQLHVRPDLFTKIDTVFSKFPIQSLHVRKGDVDFWDAIEDARF